MDDSCVHGMEELMLDELFDKYGSDKGNMPLCPSMGHGYGKFYEKVLGKYVGRKIRLLEIGVCNTELCAVCGRVHHGYPRQAHSLLAWRDYFPGSEIVGMDYKDCSDIECGGIKIYLGDQQNPRDLNKTMEGGKFDIIIDDGSHFYIHQMYTMSLMFPQMNPEGMYIIEDVKTGWPRSKFIVDDKVVMENCPHAVGAYVALLHNTGIVNAVYSDDKYGEYMTIAIERGNVGC